MAEQTPWHTLDSETCLARLASGRQGLSGGEAARRLEEVGANRLPVRRRTGLAVIVLRQFTSALIYLLLGAALLSVAVGEIDDAAFILAVLILNAAIGSVQEWQSEKSAAALAHYIETEAEVWRDGRRRSLPAAELVPGDLVALESGQAVPADLRLLSSRSLIVEEAALTGESLPVTKDAESALAADAPLGQRANQAFAGTMVQAGRGLGLVVATGADTEIGRIAGGLSGSAGAKPPLLLRLERLTRQISLIAMLGIVVFAVLQYLAGESGHTVILTAVALAVSAIPEGLPVAVTVVLSVARKRMADRNVIVRSLPAVEGLGACTVIASDKTGTLTANRLMVARVLLPDGRTFAVEGEGYHPDGHAHAEGQQAAGADLQALQLLAESAARTAEGYLRPAEEGGWSHGGDSVDIACLALAGRVGLDHQALQGDGSTRSWIPYEPRLRLAAALSDEVLLHAKGAAETLFEAAGGVPETLSRGAEALARDGYRVLAVGRRRLAARPEEHDRLGPLQGIEVLGLIGLIDPVRQQVPEAIAACHAGGVRVAMVTGDHPETALAIARQLGIARAAEQVVTGQELAALDGEPERRAARIETARVFARIEPLQKLQIVESLQAGGHFVAVTGDGVNDALALKAANIGVAMGRDGTDVAREAADLVLTDDNFASLAQGIEQGRIAYANLRKVVLLLLCTGLAEVVLFALCIAGGLPIPLFATQLLWLNLVTNGVQHVALSFEPGEPDIARQRPRNPKEAILNPRLLGLIAGYGAVMGLLATAVFALALAWGHPPDTARTAALIALVLFENVCMLTARSETRSLLRVPLFSNRFALLSVAGALLLQWLAFSLPWLAEPLRLVPLPFELMALVLPATALFLLATEAIKWRLRRRDAEAPLPAP